MQPQVFNHIFTLQPSPLLCQILAHKIKKNFFFFSNSRPQPFMPLANFVLSLTLFSASSTSIFQHHTSEGVHWLHYLRRCSPSVRRAGHNPEGCSLVENHLTTIFSLYLGYFMCFMCIFFHNCFFVFVANLKLKKSGESKGQVVSCTPLIGNEV